MESYRSTKWDLEVTCTPTNSVAVLKLPLAHPVGLPEKCTYCITDQLTLSAAPRNDWHCALRKLQTFTRADKTRFPPHTSFSTSLSLETLQSFMLWSSAGNICQSLLFLGEHFARKLRHCDANKANMNHEINNSWFVDNRNLTCVSPPTLKKKKSLWPQSRHFIKTQCESSKETIDNTRLLIFFIL